MIGLERHRDHRGFFARTFCKKEFENVGLASEMVQANTSFNEKRATLRGMHYQRAPHAEAKLVRCTRGALYDVIVDVRPNSRTFKEWFGVKLTAQNYRMLYVPKGFAHGFITLKDRTEVMYQVSQFYAPDAGQGLRYDDPAIGIDWPLTPEVISDKDRSWAAFSEMV